MKVIIAPSKTMKYRDDRLKSTPLLFPNQTNYIYSQLKNYNDEQLCELMKISYKQSAKVYDFFHKKYPVCPALSLYQGTVFKQLQIDLYHQHLQYLDTHLCIMSAYYGVLKYNTGITPYRLDMTMKPNNMNLYDYWYTPIYQYFENEDFIISLSSKEFTQMIHHPHLYFIDFVEIKDNKLKRNAMIVKKARGQMLNHMILHEIMTLKDIQNICIDGFQYNFKLSDNHTLVFSRSL